MGTSQIKICFSKYIHNSISNYRAAFFHGQVEQPVRGLMSLVNHKDVEVLIAVNERGVFIIDPIECVSICNIYKTLLRLIRAKKNSHRPYCSDYVMKNFRGILLNPVRRMIQIVRLVYLFRYQKFPSQFFIFRCIFMYVNFSFVCVDIFFIVPYTFFFFLLFFFHFLI